LLGNSCNLNCQFCFWDLRLKDISLTKKKIIIDEIKNSGIKKITISGGEPLCNKDLFPVLKYAKNNGLEVVLHTNGLLINDKVAHNLKGLVSRVSLSLDGSSEEIIHKMRKSRGMFSHTVWLVKKLCNLGIPVNIKTVITKINQNDISNIGNIVSRLPIEYWSLLEFNPINRGLINKDKFYLDPKKFDSVITNMKKHYPHLVIKVHKFVRKPNKYCFVASNGDVYKYVANKGDELVGNLFEKGLKNILTSI